MKYQAVRSVAAIRNAGALASLTEKLVKLRRDIAAS
jgi:hypothetical protein